MDAPISLLRPLLGARIIKTGLSVFLSLIAFHWIGASYAIFAAVAAILAVQPSISRARLVFGQQLVANLIGGAVGAALAFWFGSSALLMAVGVILVLGICSRFQLNDAASIAVVVVLFVMNRPEQDVLLFTAARMGAVIGGMLVGYVVNRTILPPNYTARLHEELLLANQGAVTLGESLIHHLHDPEQLTREAVRKQVATVQQRLDRGGYFLALFKDQFPDHRYLPHLERLTNSTNVIVQRIMDLHRILLEAGGLAIGTSRATVTRSLYGLLQYQQELLRCTLNEVAADPATAQFADQSLSELDALTHGLIAGVDRREEGLLLHSLLTDLRHVQWRLDTHCRMLKETTAS